MNKKEKQIEEMAILARVFCQTIEGGGSCEKCAKCGAYRMAERFYNAGYRKASEVVAEVVTEIKNFITSEIAKREYHTEIEIKTQAKTYNRVWAMLDKIEKKYKGTE